jgi:oxygen-independent coproporphyrinogen-3 oxidase
VDRVGASNSFDEDSVVGNYFVATYPPFSQWRGDTLDKVHNLLASPPASRTEIPFGLYVHIPFCVKRCEYCYYLSYADKSGNQIDRYLDGIAAELEIYRRSPALADRKVAFIYFGGGTPSLLSVQRIRRLFGRLQQIYPWTDVREVSFECAPQTVTEPKLGVLREYGVTRVSLGVQQLDDRVLGQSGRVHLVEDVVRAYCAIRKTGFEYVNLDLMVGMAGETDRSFFDSIERLITMAPESITIYQLEIPLNTPLYRSLRGGIVQSRPATWDVKRSRLQKAFARLESAGYSLRSAYTAARDPERHRFVYQDAQYRGADVLGLGASSFSYLSGIHFQNLSSFTSYIECLEQDRLPLERAYALSVGEQLTREFVLQLKLGRAEAAHFRSKFGVDISERFSEPLSRLARQKWLTFDEDGVSLTRLGLLRVDRLIPAFYQPEHSGTRYS